MASLSEDAFVDLRRGLRVGIFEQIEVSDLHTVLPLHLGMLRLQVHSKNHALRSQDDDEIETLSAVSHIQYDVSVVLDPLLARVEGDGAGDVVDFSGVAHHPPHPLLRSSWGQTYLLTVLPQYSTAFSRTKMFSGSKRSNCIIELSHPLKTLSSNQATLKLL